MRIGETGKNTHYAASLLTQGKLVAIPTETVYGLAANALDERAVLNIFEVKQRPYFDPLIIHLPSVESVEKYATWPNSKLKELARAFWPGPLTLLLPKKSIVPAIVTSGLEQVAVRIPDHALTLELLRELSFPLAAPSANPFGYISPTTAQHVEKQLGGKIDYILDGGPCEVGIESTIVGMEGDTVCVYRLGGLAVEEIERIAGKVELKINASGDPKAPGQLKSHYAPKKPLITGNVSELLKKYNDKRVGVICFGEEKFAAEKIFNLSETGSLKEAAINLFKFLREADESDIDLILASVLPEEGLGKAINDRLKRAAV